MIFCDNFDSLLTRTDIEELQIVNHIFCQKCNIFICNVIISKNVTA